jgi:putative DNA methylase
VALPLEAINVASFAEKNRKVGKPQNLHQWWSRKPVTAARAMLIAQLVDDPSSDPERFPTEDGIRTERARLHALIERAVEWDEVVRPTPQFLTDMRAVLPDVTVTDPFIGGGSIALAAAQLGVDSSSSDLNPVAVALSRALVDVPTRFFDREPVNPELRGAQLTLRTGTAGLVADVEAYGEWMLAEARTRIGQHYPSINGRAVLAWVWARQVACPNPACQIQVPLVSKWTLAKKRGKEAVIVPRVVHDSVARGGARFEFSVSKDKRDLLDRGTMSGRTGTACLNCGTAISVGHVRDEAMAGRMGMALTAIASDGGRTREYFAPTEEHREAAKVARPVDSIAGAISTNPRWFSPPLYGLSDFSDLFTDRQLLAVTTFSDLVDEAARWSM